MSVKLVGVRAGSCACALALALSAPVAAFAESRSDSESANLPDINNEQPSAASGVEGAASTATGTGTATGGASGAVADATTTSTSSAETGTVASSANTTHEADATAANTSAEAATSAKSASNQIIVGTDIMSITVADGRIKAESLSGAGSRPGLHPQLQIIGTDGTVVSNISVTDQNTTAFQEAINGQAIAPDQLIRLSFDEPCKLVLRNSSDGSSQAVTTNTWGSYFALEGDSLKALDSAVRINPVSAHVGDDKITLTGVAAADSDIFVQVGNTKAQGRTNALGDFSLEVKLVSPLTAQDSILASSDGRVWVQASASITAPDPYLFIKNVWGGNSFQLTFNQSTHTLAARQMSGAFGSQENIFDFKLIHAGSSEAYFSHAQKSTQVKTAVAALQGQSYMPGDIIAFRSGPGLGNRADFVSDSENFKPSQGRWSYYRITDVGFEPYKLPVTVNPLQVLGPKKLTSLNIQGTTLANSPVKVYVAGHEADASEVRANDTGAFSVDLSYEPGFEATTAINVAAGDFIVTIYPSRQTVENLDMVTDSGYRYTLNMGLDRLLEPLNPNVVYSYSILSDSAKKAWLEASRQLLTSTDWKHFDNVNSYIDVSYDANLNLTEKDLQLILKYLVRNDPRMFFLKDWPDPRPIKRDGKIVGQRFIVGNGMRSAEDVRRVLLEVEKGVSDILQYITPDLDVYQIIKLVELKYEGSVNYRNTWNASDIRGAFIDKQVICGGYSKGFEYLMLRLGIETIWVQGWVPGPHAWNYINTYGSWHLTDTTWGGANWYMLGSDAHKFLDSRRTMEVYDPQPTLSPYTIPWAMGDRNARIANTMGIVKAEKTGDNQISISYDTSSSEVENQTVEFRSSLDNYEPHAMEKQGKRWVYNLTVDPALADEAHNINFNYFFRVNEKFNTAGNVAASGMISTLLPNGMNNLEYSGTITDPAFKAEATQGISDYLAQMIADLDHLGQGVDKDAGKAMLNAAAKAQLELVPNVDSAASRDELIEAAHRSLNEVMDRLKAGGENPQPPTPVNPSDGNAGGSDSGSGGADAGSSAGAGVNPDTGQGAGKPDAGGDTGSTGDSHSSDGSNTGESKPDQGGSMGPDQNSGNPKPDDTTKPGNNSSGEAPHTSSTGTSGSSDSGGAASTDTSADAGSTSAGGSGTGKSGSGAAGGIGAGLQSQGGNGLGGAQFSGSGKQSQSSGSGNTNQAAAGKMAQGLEAAEQQGSQKPITEDESKNANKEDKQSFTANTLWMWILGIVALLSLGVAYLLFLKKKRS